MKWNGPGSMCLHYIAFYHSSVLYLVLGGTTKCHRFGKVELSLDTLTFKVRTRHFISQPSRLPLIDGILTSFTCLFC